MPQGASNCAAPVTTRQLTARAGLFGAVAEDESGTYARIDAEGRWTAFGEQGACWRRTVDGQVVRRSGRGFRDCDERERAGVDARVCEVLQRFAEAVRQSPGATLRLMGEHDELARRLGVGATWTPARMAAERSRFARAYPERAEILPPHRYRDLVLLPATGCPNGQCTFCAFYRDRRFRIFTGSEFEAHLAAVQSAFGAALAERSGVFLGSASALSIPNTVLLARLQRIGEVFGPRRRGVAAFLDPDRSPLRRESDWRALQEAGLVETCVGLETGLPSLRAAVGKSADLRRVATSIARQKAAGLRVSLVVLVGLGGMAQERAHREATLDVLARMPLDASDTVYLSPLVSGTACTLPPGNLAEWRRACETTTQARTGIYLVERYAWLS